METSTTEKLFVLFRDTFHIEVPKTDTDLLESGTLDSFQFVELLAQIEHRFNVEIDIGDLDLDDLRTLDRIAALIDGRNNPQRQNAAGVRA